MAKVFKAENFSGLSEDQVRRKLEQEGYNELPSSKSKGIWELRARSGGEPMFLLLVACGALYLLLGDVQEGDYAAWICLCDHGY